MLLFAGDPHGSYEHLYPFVQENDSVALIILGDLQLSSPDELDKLHNIVIFGLFMATTIAKPSPHLRRFGGRIGNRVICIIVLLKSKVNALPA